MSLSDYGFDLLPIPKRSVFSWGNETTRATFPDFNTTDQMTNFIQRLFVLQVNIPTFYVQIKICAALFLAIILVDILILGRRRYEKSLWLARLVRKPSGTIIVPNAALAFLVIEAGFVILLIAFIFMAIEYYQTQQLQPHNLPLWILLIWFPAFLGVFMSMVGCYFTTPSTKPFQDQSKEDVEGFFTRLKNNAIFINSVIILIPVAVLISVFIPSIMANAQFMQAQKLQIEWQAKYANQGYFTLNMVIEAQTIWYMVLKSTYLAAIVFCIWCFWAMFCFISFTICATRLLLTIYNEYCRTDTANSSFVVTNTTISINKIITEALQQKNNRTHSGQKRTIGGRTETEGDIPLDHLEHLGQLDTAMTDCWHSDFSLSSKDPLNETNRSSARRKLSFLRRGNTANSDQQNKTFSERIKGTLPRLIITPQIEEEQIREEANQPESDQKQSIKRAGLMMMIHLCLHSPACAIFSAIALFMALTVHGSFEQPWYDEQDESYGNMFEHFGAIALLFVSYSTLIIGLGGSISLLKRTYEPVFSSLSPSSPHNRNNNNDNHPATNETTLISNPNTLADTSSKHSAEPRLVEPKKVLKKGDTIKGKPIRILQTTNSSFFETQSRAQI